jgi:hypothetical protein
MDGPLLGEEEERPSWLRIGFNQVSKHVAMDRGIDTGTTGLSSIVTARHLRECA